jgi:transposase InsO family protein
VTRYVEERRDAFGVEPICRAIGVPVCTFYARRSRKPSRREFADQELLAEIEAARSGYRRVYGARKTWLELRRRGVDVGRDQVARVMREHRITGKLRGRKHRTTIPDEAAIEKARDLLQRDFTATGPNEKWVADITYLRTWNGFLYLAFVLDCYSRMIVGWQLATHMRAELVVDALEMANGLRRPGAGLIAHSDRGSQYTSVTYTERLDELKIDPSVGSKGDAYDNAMAEAWVATFKSELVDGRRFPSFEHAEHEVLHWIGFYNGDRLHEALDDLPPAEYEELNIKTTTPQKCPPPNNASNGPRVDQAFGRWAHRRPGACVLQASRSCALVFGGGDAMATAPSKTSGPRNAFISLSWNWWRRVCASRRTTAAYSAGSAGRSPGSRRSTIRSAAHQ